MMRPWQTLLLSVIALGICYLAGNHFLLASLRMELADRQDRMQALDIELARLTARLEALEQSGKTGQPANKQRPVRLLEAGKEGTLPGLLLGLARELRFELDSIEFLPSFFCKDADREMSAPIAVISGPNQQLPELNSDGMPVGVIANADEQEWSGFEILPVQTSYHGTYRRFGQFLSAAENKFPLFSVRRCLVNINEIGITRGQLVFTFPVKGGKPPLGMAN